MQSLPLRGPYERRQRYVGQVIFFALHHILWFPKELTVKVRTHYRDSSPSIAGNPLPSTSEPLPSTSESLPSTSDLAPSTSGLGLTFTHADLA
eukprot:7212439-Pyramimonas_sp.AAC.2